MRLEHLVKEALITKRRCRIQACPTNPKEKEVQGRQSGHFPWPEWGLFSYRSVEVGKKKPGSGPSPTEPELRDVQNLRHKE